MEWTIHIKRGTFQDEDGKRFSHRATIDTEPQIVGLGHSFPEAVDALLEALDDLPAPEET